MRYIPHKPKNKIKIALIIATILMAATILTVVFFVPIIETVSDDEYDGMVCAKACSDIVCHEVCNDIPKVEKITIFRYLTGGIK